MPVNGDSYTIRTEHGVRRRMTHMEIHELVRSSMKKAKRSSTQSHRKRYATSSRVRKAPTSPRVRRDVPQEHRVEPKKDLSRCENSEIREETSSQEAAKTKAVPDGVGGEMVAKEEPKVVPTSPGSARKGYTVQTEAMGKKVMSQDEINQFVRYSMQKARQNSGQRVGYVIKSPPSTFSTPKQESPRVQKVKDTSPVGTLNRKFSWSFGEEDSLAAPSKDGVDSRAQINREDEQRRVEAFDSRDEMETQERGNEIEEGNSEQRNEGKSMEITEEANDILHDSMMRTRQLAEEIFDLSRKRSRVPKKHARQQVEESVLPKIGHEAQHENEQRKVQESETRHTSVVGGTETSAAGVNDFDQIPTMGLFMEPDDSTSRRGKRDPEGIHQRDIMNDDPEGIHQREIMNDFLYQESSHRGASDLEQAHSESLFAEPNVYDVYDSTVLSFGETTPSSPRECSPTRPTVPRISKTWSPRLTDHETPSSPPKVLDAMRFIAESLQSLHRTTDESEIKSRHARSFGTLNSASPRNCGKSERNPLVSSSWSPKQSRMSSGPVQVQDTVRHLHVPLLRSIDETEIETIHASCLSEATPKTMDMTATTISQQDERESCRSPVEVRDAVRTLTESMRRNIDETEKPPDGPTSGLSSPIEGTSFEPPSGIPKSRSTQQAEQAASSSSDHAPKSETRNPAGTDTGPTPVQFLDDMEALPSSVKSTTDEVKDDSETRHAGVVAEETSLYVDNQKEPFAQAQRGKRDSFHTSTEDRDSVHTHSEAIGRSIDGMVISKSWSARQTEQTSASNAEPLPKSEEPSTAGKDTDFTAVQPENDMEAVRPSVEISIAEAENGIETEIETTYTTAVGEESPFFSRDYSEPLVQRQLHISASCSSKQGERELCRSPANVRDAVRTPSEPIDEAETSPAGTATELPPPMEGSFDRPPGISKSLSATQPEQAHQRSSDQLAESDTAEEEANISAVQVHENMNDVFLTVKSIADEAQNDVETKTSNGHASATGAESTFSQQADAAVPLEPPVPRISASWSPKQDERESCRSPARVRDAMRTLTESMRRNNDETEVKRNDIPTTSTAAIATASESTALERDTDVSRSLIPEHANQASPGSSIHVQDGSSVEIKQARFFGGVVSKSPRGSTPLKPILCISQSWTAGQVEEFHSRPSHVWKPDILNQPEKAADRSSPGLVQDDMRAVLESAATSRYAKSTETETRHASASGEDTALSKQDDAVPFESPVPRTTGSWSSNLDERESCRSPAKVRVAARTLTEPKRRKIDETEASSVGPTSELPPPIEGTSFDRSPGVSKSLSATQAEQASPSSSDQVAKLDTPNSAEAETDITPDQVQGNMNDTLTIKSTADEAENDAETKTRHASASGEDTALSKQDDALPLEPPVPRISASWSPKQDERDSRRAARVRDAMRTLTESMRRNDETEVKRNDIPTTSTPTIAAASELTALERDTDISRQQIAKQADRESPIQVQDASYPFRTLVLTGIDKTDAETKRSRSFSEVPLTSPRTSNLLQEIPLISKSWTPKFAENESSNTLARCINSGRLHSAESETPISHIQVQDDTHAPSSSVKKSIEKVLTENVSSVKEEVPSFPKDDDAPKRTPALPNSKTWSSKQENALVRTPLLPDSKSWSSKQDERESLCSSIDGHDGMRTLAEPTHKSVDEYETELEPKQEGNPIGASRETTESERSQVISKSWSEGHVEQETPSIFDQVSKPEEPNKDEAKTFRGSFLNREDVLINDTDGEARGAGAAGEKIPPSPPDCSVPLNSTLLRIAKSSKPKWTRSIAIRDAKYATTESLHHSTNKSGTESVNPPFSITPASPRESAGSEHTERISPSLVSASRASEMHSSPGEEYGAKRTTHTPVLRSHTGIQTELIQSHFVGNPMPSLDVFSEVQTPDEPQQPSNPVHYLAGAVLSTLGCSSPERRDQAGIAASTRLKQARTKSTKGNSQAVTISSGLTHLALPASLAARPFSPEETMSPDSRNSSPEDTFQASRSKQGDAKSFSKPKWSPKKRSAAVTISSDLTQLALRSHLVAEPEDSIPQENEENALSTMSHRRPESEKAIETSDIKKQERCDDTVTETVGEAMEFLPSSRCETNSNAGRPVSSSSENGVESQEEVHKLETGKAEQVSSTDEVAEPPKGVRAANEEESSCPQSVSWTDVQRVDTQVSNVEIPNASSHVSRMVELFSGRSVEHAESAELLSLNTSEALNSCKNHESGMPPPLHTMVDHAQEEKTRTLVDQQYDHHQNKSGEMNQSPGPCAVNSVEVLETTGTDREDILPRPVDSVEVLEMSGTDKYDIEQGKMGSGHDPACLQYADQPKRPDYAKALYKPDTDSKLSEDRTAMVAEQMQTPGEAKTPTVEESNAKAVHGSGHKTDDSWIRPVSATQDEATERYEIGQAHLSQQVAAEQCNIQQPSEDRHAPGASARRTQAQQSATREFGSPKKADPSRPLLTPKLCWSESSEDTDDFERKKLKIMMKKPQILTRTPSSTSALSSDQSRKHSTRNKKRRKGRQSRGRSRRRKSPRRRNHGEKQRNDLPEKIVITDDLLAEISSKKGAKVTAEELDQLLQSAGHVTSIDDKDYVSESDESDEIPTDSKCQPRCANRLFCVDWSDLLVAKSDDISESADMKDPNFVDALADQIISVFEDRLPRADTVDVDDIRTYMSGHGKSVTPSSRKSSKKQDFIDSIGDRILEVIEKDQPPSDTEPDTYSENFRSFELGNGGVSFSFSQGGPSHSEYMASFGSFSENDDDSAASAATETDHEEYRPGWWKNI